MSALLQVDPLDPDFSFADPLAPLSIKNYFFIRLRFLGFATGALSPIAWEFEDDTLANRGNFSRSFESHGPVRIVENPFWHKTTGEHQTWVTPALDHNAQCTNPDTLFFSICATFEFKNSMILRQTLHLDLCHRHFESVQICLGYRLCNTRL